MIAAIACPACGQAGELPDSHRGLLIRCPSCGTQFGVPAPAEATRDLGAADTTQPERWFYKTAGRVYGPVCSLDFVRLVEEGKILPETQVRKGTAGPWIRASKIKALFRHAAVPAAVPEQETACFVARPPKPATVPAAQIGRISQGMRAAEVIELLGQPAARHPNPPSPYMGIWTYRDNGQETLIYFDAGGKVAAKSSKTQN